MNEQTIDQRDQPTFIGTELSASQYIPLKAEILKEYEINIRFHSIGCVISVGCKSVPFSTVEEGMKALNAYVANPFEEQKKWNKIFEGK